MVAVLFDLSIRQIELLQFIISSRQTNSIEFLEEVKKQIGEDRKAAFWLFYQLERFFRNLLRKFLLTHRELIVRAILQLAGCETLDDLRKRGVSVFEKSYLSVFPLLLLSIGSDSELDVNDIKTILKFDDYECVRSVLQSKFNSKIYSFPDSSFTIFSSPSFSFVLTKVRNSFRSVSQVLTSLSLSNLSQVRVNNLKVLTQPYLIEIRGPDMAILDPVTQDLIRFFFLVHRTRSDKLHRVFEPLIIQQIRTGQLSDAQKRQLRHPFSQFIIQLIPSTSDWSAAPIVLMDKNNFNSFLSNLIVLYKNSKDVTVEKEIIQESTDPVLTPSSSGSFIQIPDKLRLSDVEEADSEDEKSEKEENEPLKSIPTNAQIVGELPSLVHNDRGDLSTHSSSSTQSIRTEKDAARNEVMKASAEIQSSGKFVAPVYVRGKTNKQKNHRQKNSASPSVEKEEKN